MHFMVWYITVRKKAKINIFDNVLFTHNFPEFCQNFGISVPMKKNNKKKKKILFFNYFFIFFLYKEVLAFWYLWNLKTRIIHVSRNVLSFLKHTVLYMYLSVFIDNLIKKTQKYMFLVVIVFFHKGCFVCDLAFWYVGS